MDCMLSSTIEIVIPRSCVLGVKRNHCEVHLMVTSRVIDYNYSEWQYIWGFFSAKKAKCFL